MNAETFALKVQKKYGLKQFELYENRRGHIELSIIQLWPEHRGKGIGSKAVQELCDYADRNGKLVWLSVANKSRTRLIRFYRRFGFVRNFGRTKRFDISMYAMMYREPKE